METKASMDEDLIFTGEAEPDIKPQDAAEKALLPERIKTQSNVNITFYDRQKHFPSRVRYGDIKSASLVEVPSVEPDPILEQLMKAGMIEEQDGGINQEIAVPAEFVTLPNGENCAVLLTDLSGCIHGLVNLQRQEGVSPQELFAILSKLANAATCLRDKDIYIQKWDGHAFYFNPQFGVFTLALDGQLLSNDDKLNEAYATDKALAATLLYLLTGAFPVNAEGEPYSALLEVQTTASLCFDSTVHTQENDVEVFWNALPQKLRKAFEDCFFAPNAPAPEAREWAKIFSELAASVESESCIHCRRQVIAGAPVCPYCGGDLDKRQLLSKWLVINKANSHKFGLALPVNMALDSAILSPDCPKGALLRMGYNAKKNMLALQNISSSVLAVDYGELGTIEAESQCLFAVKSGMQITGAQLQGITLLLLGFDAKDYWEVE